VRRALPIVFLLAALAAPAAAQARVAVVATGGPDAAFVDVNTRQIVGTLTMPGATQAVAAAPDGGRAYVGADGYVVGIDLASRTPVATVGLPGPVGALAVT